MSGVAALQLDAVAKSYRQGDVRLDVLNGVDLEVAAGEVTALTAPSGAGKTTLLQIAGLLDRPDAGRVRIAGHDADALDDGRRSRLRSAELGFVFQFHCLLPEFTALENIVLPQAIAGIGRRTAGRRAAELLEMMGLSDRASHRPAALSGGEQQRVAIARALANGPSLVLADEPTGNLDQDTAFSVMKSLIDLAHGAGVAMLVATHNPELAARMDRRVRLEGGKLREGAASPV